MNKKLYETLYKQGLLSDTSIQLIRKDSRLFSLHWEMKTMLYMGIMLLSGALGILVYKNIDSIGHQAILISIGLISASSFTYCFMKKSAYSADKVTPPTVFFDYILLLGCLSFIVFVAYFQYRYQLFGNRFGLATFIPMLVLFFTAYYFDHIGVLSLAITNLAAWVGITVTPLQILRSNDFDNGTIIISTLLLGILLLLVGILTTRKKIKAHFAFTYTNIGMHMFFIAVLAALFHFESIYLLWALVLTAGAWYFYRSAIKTMSFYTLITATLYTYIGYSYVFLNGLITYWEADLAIFYLAFIYFIVTGILLVVFLMRTNKKLKG